MGGAAGFGSGSNGGSGIVIIKYYITSSISHKYLTLKPLTLLEEKTGYNDWVHVGHLKPETTRTMNWFSDGFLNGTTTSGTAYNYDNDWELPFSGKDQILFVKGNFKRWAYTSLSAITSASGSSWIQVDAITSQTNTDGTPVNKLAVLPGSFNKFPPFIILGTSYNAVGVSGSQYNNGEEWLYIEKGTDIPQEDWKKLINTSYDVYVRSSTITPTPTTTSTYAVNFPVNTICDILAINNTQYFKTSDVILNGSYNMIVGSTSKIQNNSTDLYVPNTNLSITDSITGTSITYTTNSPIIIIRYKLISTITTTTNIIPTGYLKFDNNSWNVEYNGILTSKVLQNEICMSRYLSNNNYSMINIYEYSVINDVGVSSDWITISNKDIIYIAKSGYAGAYPTYQNNFVGNILKIRLKSCSLENVYKSFLIDHNSYIHNINCTIKNIYTGGILYNSQDININNATFFSSPELFTNGINLSTNNIPTNVKLLLELKLFVSFDASTNSTTTIKQQTDKFYLFYENF